jgi:hypothetical protein
MKLQQIKTSLFTRVSKTTFGFRFEIYHDIGNGKHIILSIGMFEDGQLVIHGHAGMSVDQLNEITRVANLLKENNNERT